MGRQHLSAKAVTGTRMVAQRLFALLSLVAVLLLSAPCAPALSAPAPLQDTRAAAVMPCCDHHVNLHAPALCCTVHAEQAVPVTVPLAAPQLPVVRVSFLPQALHVQGHAEARNAAHSPPPLLHPILRI